MKFEAILEAHIANIHLRVIWFTISDFLLLNDRIISQVYYCFRSGRCKSVRWCVCEWPSLTRLRTKEDSRTRTAWSTTLRYLKAIVGLSWMRFQDTYPFLWDWFNSTRFYWRIENKGNSTQKQENFKSKHATYTVLEVGNLF